MNSQPLVSIIIPFLNPGDWLTEAIDSVLAQTYTNLEIILIDDGSVDEDAAIALKYCGRFPGQIFYYMHESHVNKGLTASRNLGLSKARGTLIAFLDADDCWMPAKLTEQLSLFEAMPEIQVICEASLFWYNWNDVEKENSIMHIGAEPGVYNPPQLMELLYPFGEGQPPCPSGIIIKREVIDRCGGFEESFSGIYQLYEDQAFLFKVYSSEIIYISNQVNNLYRKRENSMSSAANNLEIYNTVRKFYANWIENYLTKISGHNPAIDSLLATFKNSLVYTETQPGIAL
ncbi:MAG: glycosyltransferase family 2 protein [Ferruginibacter sp.]|nr:glycosyltransferase family 2 protein [Ferruginibacter sp.]